MSLPRPETLTSAAIVHLRDAIVRGDFPPGFKLSEQALSARLEISRGTIREALRALTDTGLVQTFPHRGVFVSPLTARTAWEISSFRALLEPYGARLAIETSYGDPTMVGAVEEAHRRLLDAATNGDLDAIVNADMGFHACILSFCNHEVLREHLSDIQTLTRRLILYTKVYESDLEGEIESHAPMVAAVNAGDALRLESLVRSARHSGGQAASGEDG